MKTRRIGTGALVGGLITLPLMGVLFLAEQLAGWPFAPFDLFDWLARVLPGNVVTLGIEGMVALIGGLNAGETSSAAKTIEQLTALALFLLMGVLAGAIFFAILGTSPAQWSNRAGLILGLAAGLVMLLISASGGVVSDAAPFVGWAWIVVVFLAWGAAIGWAYHHLTPPRTAGRAEAGGVTARPAADTSVAVEPVDRRQFLLRLGGGAALITVAGAVL